MPSVLSGRIIKKNTKDLDSISGMHFLQAAVSDLRRSEASLQSNAHALFLHQEGKNRILSMWLLWATFYFLTVAELLIVLTANKSHISSLW